MQGVGGAPPDRRDCLYERNVLCTSVNSHLPLSRHRTFLDKSTVGGLVSMAYSVWRKRLSFFLRLVANRELTFPIGIKALLHKSADCTAVLKLISSPMEIGELLAPKHSMSYVMVSKMSSSPSSCSRASYLVVVYQQNVREVSTRRIWL